MAVTARKFNESVSSRNINNVSSPATPLRRQSTSEKMLTQAEIESHTPMMQQWIHQY